MDNNDFGFKNLHVWQRAIDFSDKVFYLLENLNCDRKHFRLVEQCEAAVSGIAMNIAEGKGRRSEKTFVQFLLYARGSLNEVIALMEIFRRRNWISKQQQEEIEADGLALVKMIYGLINTIENRK